jgi:uncharacterized protein
VLDQALADSPGYGLVSSAPLSAHFTKVSGQVHLKGGFSALVQAPCKRCLKDVSLEVPVAFTLRMVAEPRREDDEDDEQPGLAAKGPPRKHHHKKDDDHAASEAGSFELDAVDAEPFDGKTIDLDPIVREQLLLALPVAVVCREDCKGLCAACGQDLNESDCGHGGQRELDPRLAKLKDIKL